jgi:hypothetical protein
VLHTLCDLLVLDSVALGSRTASCWAAETEQSIRDQLQETIGKCEAKIETLLLDKQLMELKQCGSIVSQGDRTLQQIKSTLSD